MPPKPSSNFFNQILKPARRQVLIMGFVREYLSTPGSGTTSDFGQTGGSRALHALSPIQIIDLYRPR